MLKRDQTHLILELYKKGHGLQRIQKILMLSHAAVQRVIRSQSPDPTQQKYFVDKPKVVLIDNTHVVNLKSFPRRRR